MKEDVSQVIQMFNQFEPKDDDWFEIDEILEKLFKCKNPKLSLEAMFRVFERYPNEDNEILWGMLHAIESIPDYENELLDSVKRTPSFFTVLMINRILNANIQRIGKQNLLGVLKSILENDSVSKKIKDYAKEYIEWQGKR